MATDGLTDTLLYRPTEAEAFRPVAATNFKDTLDPLYFTFDDRDLYVATNLGRDKQAIYRYDPEKGKMLDLIYENPEVDVSTPAALQKTPDHHRGHLLHRQAPLPLL